MTSYFSLAVKSERRAESSCFYLASFKVLEVSGRLKIICSRDVLLLIKSDIKLSFSPHVARGRLRSTIRTRKRNRTQVWKAWRAISGFLY